MITSVEGTGCGLYTVRSALAAEIPDREQGQIQRHLAQTTSHIEIWVCRTQNTPQVSSQSTTRVSSICQTSALG